MTSTATIVLIVTCFGAALALLWHGLRVFAKALESLWWPRVAAVIVNADMVTSNWDAEMNRPQISYRFQVSGQALTGERIAFGMENFYSNLGFTQRYLRRYAIGQNVYISYAPYRPSLTVLEPGVTPWAFLPMAFGALFLCVSVVLMLAWAPYSHSSLNNAQPNTQSSFGRINGVNGSSAITRSSLAWRAVRIADDRPIRPAQAIRSAAPSAKAATHRRHPN